MNRLLGSATLTLLLSACALGPDYRRPDVQAPATFRDQADAASASYGDLGWWQVYDDPALQAL
ncbi:hypothetical protein ABI084_15040, partial [Enterococcus faecium]